MRPQIFCFGKNFANWQNIKDAVVLGWGRQIFAKLSQTMGITAVTVNACQFNMKNDTCRKISSSSWPFIMNRRGYFFNPAQFQGFYVDSLEYPHHAPVYHHMTGREMLPSTSHANISLENIVPARSMQASTSQGSSSSSSQSSPDPEPIDAGKHSYEKWSDDEEQMLINLWAENFERINSSQARKAWDDITKQMKLKFGTKRATEKFHKKIKYLIERYKTCKDWNSKQTGGNLRKSAHFDKIDAVMGCRNSVTLSNMKEVRSAVSEQEESTGKDQG